MEICQSKLPSMNIQHPYRHKQSLVYLFLAFPISLFIRSMSLIHTFLCDTPASRWCFTAVTAVWLRARLSGTIWPQRIRLLRLSGPFSGGTAGKCLWKTTTVSHCCLTHCSENMLLENLFGGVVPLTHHLRMPRCISSL